MGTMGSNGTERDHGETAGTPSSASTPAAREAIAGFWAWWATEGKAEASELFAGRGDPERFEAFSGAIGARVQAMGDLAVATGPGHDAKHCLVLTAGGNPDLRDLAAAWLAAAPPTDEEFEYADHRQAHPEPASLTLRFEGGELDLASTTVVAIAEGGKVHVQLAHPQFAELDEDDRGQVTFLFLDAVLGERAVEDRIGEVAWAAAHADGVGSVSLLELPGIVAAAG